jgi:quercetin dioxygenase-like cupin family protein
VLDDATIQRLVESIAPAELTSADRASMLTRILERLNLEGPSPAARDLQPVKVVPVGPEPDNLVPVSLEVGQDEPPPGTLTIRAATMRWLAAGPGVEVMVVRSNRERNDQTVLIRMQPGSEVVGHRHTMEEECLILEGEVYIGGHRLGRGDMHVASPGAVHAPIRSTAGALLLIRSEIPPQHFRIA